MNRYRGRVTRVAPGGGAHARRADDRSVVTISRYEARRAAGLDRGDLISFGIGYQMGVVVAFDVIVDRRASAPPIEEVPVYRPAARCVLVGLRIPGSR